MKLTFLGAASTVTGSRYLIEAADKKILVDCGLFQGLKELRLRNWAPFPVDPSSIDAVVLTHAHLDHSGYIPLLVKNGFRGRIYCTLPTLDLCKLLLPDSGYLQEEDAARANRYHYTKHHPALPLYTLADAEETFKYFRPVSFGKDTRIADGISIRFERVGHIPGAAWVLLKTENRTLLFSGDIGRPHDAVMKPPVSPIDVDFLVTEGTYGDRLHEHINPLDQLEKIILRTTKRGGAIVNPAFTVGRAFNLMYYIYELKRTNRIPNDLPVSLDSPMAIQSAEITLKHVNELRLSCELCATVMRSVNFIHSVDESKKLDSNLYPQFIIAGSGMATGGRVLHHLKHFAPDSKNTILFAGFQAAGTRGDRIMRGEEEVKIHGQMISIKAEVDNLTNVSAHADYEEILQWLGSIRKPPITTFITHAEGTAALSMKRHIEERRPDWKCVIPNHLQSIML